MTVRIDSPDGDFVVEDVEQEFVDNYNESYGENLARVLPSAWRLVSYALLFFSLLLLGIYLGSLISQKKINQLNSELLSVEREAREFQTKAIRRLELTNRFVEELRMKTGFYPPLRGETDDVKRMAKYTMFKELVHVTKDLESNPKYREALRAYYTQKAVDRLYGR